MNGSRDSTEALMDEARSADCGARARGGGTRRHAIPQYSAAPRRPQRSEGSAGEGAHWVRHAVRSGGGAGEEWGWGWGGVGLGSHKVRHIRHGVVGSENVGLCRGPLHAGCVIDLRRAVSVVLWGEGTLGASCAVQWGLGGVG